MNEYIGKKELTPEEALKYNGSDQIVHFMDYLNSKEQRLKSS